MSANQPTESAPSRQGLIQVYTGDGKGKTTAALGLAVRAVGAGLRVAFVYFDKGGEHYSERKVLTNQLRDSVEIFPTGLDRIDPATNKFRFGVTPEDKAEADRGLVIAERLILGETADIVILDEVLSAIGLGMLADTDLLAILRQKPPAMEIVLTGRHATAPVIAAADLVSEIQDVKHYLRQGVSAREGIDY